MTCWVMGCEIEVKYIFIVRLLVELYTTYLPTYISILNILTRCLYRLRQESEDYDTIDDIV